MVKMRKGNTIVLGLSDENIKRLKKNQPIKFNLKDLNLEDINVYIIAGKTEDSIALTLKTMMEPIN